MTKINRTMYDKQIQFKDSQNPHKENLEMVLINY